MLGNVPIDTTIIGLILFFSAFIGVLIYVYLPGSKKKMKEFGDIPLKEDDDG